MLINFDKNQWKFEVKYIRQIFILIYHVRIKNILKSLAKINKNIRIKTCDTFSHFSSISDLKDFDKFS